MSPPTWLCRIIRSSANWFSRGVSPIIWRWRWRTSARRRECCASCWASSGSAPTMIRWRPTRASPELIRGLRVVCQPRPDVLVATVLHRSFLTIWRLWLFLHVRKPPRRFLPGSAELLWPGLILPKTANSISFDKTGRLRYQVRREIVAGARKPTLPGKMTV